MIEAALTDFLRDSQDGLNAINDSLKAALTLAKHNGVAPLRIARIQHAIDDNQHAWDQLNQLATSLELTDQDAKP